MKEDVRSECGRNRLDHNEVHVVHALLAEVELVVVDLIQNRVAISFPHPSQDLSRHDNAAKGLL